MSQTFEELLDSCADDCGRMTGFVRLKSQWIEVMMVDPELTHGVKVVAFWIIHHLNYETLACYPSIDRLSRLANTSKSTVHDAVSRLQIGGYLRVTPGKQGRGHSNSYEPLIKGTLAELLEARKKVRPPNYSENKSSVSGSEKFGSNGVKVRLERLKGTPSELNTSNTSKNTSLNTHRASRDDVDDDAAAIESQLRKFEEHLTGWKAKGAINDAKASKLRTWFAQLLADVRTERTTLERAKIWVGKVAASLNAFEAKPIEPATPTAVEADGSPGKQTASPCKAKKSLAKVKPVDPKALLKQQVQDDWMAGKITRDEAAKRIAAIDAAPADGHTN